MDEDVRAVGQMAEQLLREVLGNGYGVSLPSALPDAWFQRVKDSCEKLFADVPDCQDDYAREPVASTMLIMLVMKTLHDQGTDVSGKGVPLDKLHEYMGMYRVEVHMESLRRLGLVQSTPATVENIFDPQREIRYSGQIIEDLIRERRKGERLN